APNSLQNPTDPDATYRKKGKKKHIGYTANIIEKFDDAVQLRMALKMMTYQEGNKVK
ncbi:unnamed protein product, partial [marine sediment metagenome]